MRKLNTRDVVMGVRLIKKRQLKETLEQVVNEAVEKGKTERMTGIDVIFTMIESMVGTDDGRELYEWISGPLECTADEVEKMELVTLIDSLIQAASVEEWRDFFGRLDSSLRTGSST